MKRYVLWGAIMLLGMVGCAKKESTEDLSLKKIKEKGAFVLGLDDAFPPMGYRNEQNEIVGYDIDLAREVARRLGVQLVLQPIDWNAKEQELNTGKIDCIWNGFTITEERAKNLLFTKPYLKNAQVVVVKKTSPYQTLEDLKGKTLGLQAGSSAAEALNASEEFKKTLKKIVEFKDNLTALMDLEIGGVDGVLMDRIVANDTIQRSGKAFRIILPGLAEEEFGIGFRKQDIALRDAVEQALLEMAKDGKLAEITTTWFGEDISILGK
ncbi:MAG: amino acid ABC transporter substrate-binding protein [Treponemataceae bacterium]|nr:amino acid ABC transporter substrate-binding protein [Treponemataceae bacterium]